MSQGFIKGNKSLELNKSTDLKNDIEYKTSSEAQSEKYGAYNISNFQSSECRAESQRNLSIVHPTVNFRDGTGWSSIDGCNIDDDSKLRNAKNLTNTREIHQLMARPLLTTSFKSRGSFNKETESKLIFSEPTSQKKQCNSLAGVTIDRFGPHKEGLKKTIQNSKHLIPEDNNKLWKRGGIDTRNLVRDSSYENRKQRNFGPPSVIN
tara:strand:+ start:220 stop:840 length:621 start_codon:yes stop_codon:yes gene_type:complete